MNIKMRLLPENYTYSKQFHVLFSSLCKSVRRTSEFYKELARVRETIKEHGVEEVANTLKDNGLLSTSATTYFEQMNEELPKVGSELQSKVLTYLLCLKE